jgi:hypothetical protein
MNVTLFTKLEISPRSRTANLSHEFQRTRRFEGVRFFPDSQQGHMWAGTHGGDGKQLRPKLVCSARKLAVGPCLQACSSEGYRINERDTWSTIKRWRRPCFKWDLVKHHDLTGSQQPFLEAFGEYRWSWYWYNYAFASVVRVFLAMSLQILATQL